MQVEPRPASDRLGERELRRARDDDFVLALKRIRAALERLRVHVAGVGEQQERERALAPRERGGDDVVAGGEARDARRRGGGDGQIEHRDVRGDDDGEKRGLARDPFRVENRAARAVQGPRLRADAQPVHHLASFAQHEDARLGEAGHRQVRVVGGIEADARHLEVHGVARQWAHAHARLAAGQGRRGVIRGGPTDGARPADAGDGARVEDAHLVALRHREQTGAARAAQRGPVPDGSRLDRQTQLGVAVRRLVLAPRGPRLERASLEAPAQVRQARRRAARIFFRGDGCAPGLGKRQTRRRRGRSHVADTERRPRIAEALEKSFARRDEARSQAGAAQRLAERVAFPSREALRDARDVRAGIVGVRVVGVHLVVRVVDEQVRVVLVALAVAVGVDGRRPGGDARTRRLLLRAPRRRRRRQLRDGGGARLRLDVGGDRRCRRAARGEALARDAVRVARAAVAEEARLARVHNLVPAVARLGARRAAPARGRQVARVAEVPVLLHERASAGHERAHVQVAAQARRAARRGRRSDVAARRGVPRATERAATRVTESATGDGEIARRRRRRRRDLGEVRLGSLGVVLVGKQRVVIVRVVVVEPDAVRAAAGDAKRRAEAPARPRGGGGGVRVCGNRGGARVVPLELALAVRHHVVPQVAQVTQPEPREAVQAVQAAEALQTLQALQALQALEPAEAAQRGVEVPEQTRR